MILAFNLLGFFTLIAGFMGVFSASVPKWLALMMMAAGALSMLSAWSHSRARPFEPFVAAVALLAIGILGIAFHVAFWFPLLAFVFSAGHLGAAAEGSHLARRVHAHAPARRVVFWRRLHLW